LGTVHSRGRTAKALLVLAIARDTPPLEMLLLVARGWVIK
jgi:hypothetical protein